MRCDGRKLFALLEKRSQSIEKTYDLCADIIKQKHRCEAIRKRFAGIGIFYCVDASGERLSVFRIEQKVL